MMGSVKKLLRRLYQNQGGFTLVELLVTVSIIVALAGATVVAVTQFASRGQQGASASEIANVQAAMDIMMTDKGVSSVTANDTTTLSSGVQSFLSVPTEGPLATYIRDNPTKFWYCWNSSGKVKQLLAAGTCPAGPY